ncbi:MAG: SDR family NAD(P)-dependent oxidoreductase [Syntrophobacteraceae bacterium]|nr:SDR family NAD(P)-dependent oxidoreductase [Syntrophobacteraceae bacterium]
MAYICREAIVNITGRVRNGLKQPVCWPRFGEIAGKTVIVTGASSGIGHAICLELAREGVNLVLNARDRGPLVEVENLCRELGVKVESVAGSAASRDISAHLVKTALQSGQFFGVIHAAGVLNPGPLVWELSEGEFQEVFDASVNGAFQLARAAIPHIEKGGFVVFFGSGAAQMAFPGIGAYCAAKAAEEHLARQLAAEAPWITTFAFRPGVVDTPMMKAGGLGKGSAAESVKMIFEGYAKRGELIAPEVPAHALVSIIKNSPGRFHGKIANWQDAVG